MSITQTKYGDLDYYKIARTWNKIERQEYIRIRKNIEIAYKEAVIRDNKLAERQRAYATLIKLTGEYYIHKNGEIVGLCKHTYKRKGRPETQVFKLRVQTEQKTKPYMTTISIDHHGFDQAYQLAIDKICGWHEIAPASNTRKIMLEAKLHYMKKNNDETDLLKVVGITKKPVNDMCAIEKILQADVSDYLQRRHIIRG